MPSPSGIITANEFLSAFKMSQEETIRFVNFKIIQAMNDIAMAKGFFDIPIRPGFDVDLMISLIREAGFEVSRWRASGFFRKPFDFIRVKVPNAPKV